MKRLFLFLLIPQSALAVDDVLILGNSYIFTQGLDAQLSEVFSAGGEDATVQALTSGGLTLADHAERARDPESPWYEALVTRAAEREWVILQDQSQTPGFPAHSSYFQDSLAGAESLDDQIESAAGETMFFLTWGRREGDSTNASLYPDFSTMQERLNEGYLAYQQATSSKDRPTWMAPVGPAFARIHDDIVASGGDPLSPDSLFWGLYNPDGSHPSPLGSYLAACVFYAALTGESPVGLQAPADIEVKLALILQEAAAAAVFEDTDWLSYPWQETVDVVDSGPVDSGLNDSDQVASGSGDSTEPTVGSPDSCGCATGAAGSGALALLGFLGIYRRRRPPR
jgi:MYXO-CTERM domain-containing protein